jgi:hypothetical protein
MPDNPNMPTSGDDPTGQAGNAGTPPAQPQPIPPTNEWQQRYAGLQQRFQGLGYQNLDAVPTADTLAQLQARANRAAELEGQVQQHQQSLQAAQADLGLATAKAREYEAKLAKYNLIAQTDPALVAFADVIPTDPDPQKQQEHITGFKTRLSAYSGGAAQPPQPIVPASAPQAGGTQALADQVVQAYQAWTAAIMTAKPDEVEALRNRYYELNAKLEQSEGRRGDWDLSNFVKNQMPTR